MSDYLIHFNGRHDKKGRFTFGDGDGDGQINDRKYRKLDKMSDKKLHKTLKREIQSRRGSVNGQSNRWARNTQIGKNSKKLLDDSEKNWNVYKNTPEYKSWYKKLNALNIKSESGEISDKDYSVQYKKLLSDKPKVNFTNLHFVKMGSEYLDNYINKGGKKISTAYLKDLGYNDKKAKEYVDRLARSNMTLGDV